LYSHTSTASTPVFFENTIGRLSVHPLGHYIGIEYHNVTRRAAELHTFLVQADQLLAQWGWDKLLTPQITMLDFTAEELQDMCAHWEREGSQRPALLHGSLLLPHKVFVSLSRQTS
jgi:hypothetical protein